MTAPPSNTSSAPDPGTDQQYQDSDAEAVAALVVVLLAGGAILSVQRVLDGIGETNPQVTQWMMAQPDITDLLRQPGLPTTDLPVNLQRRQNAFRKAAYLINAARRLAIAWQSGRPDGTQLASLHIAYTRELSYLHQHLHAQVNRNRAAIAVAQQYNRRGRSGLLGWRAVMDARTSTECRAAHGCNFDPTRIPPIGYPGSVHPACRCRAVRPYDTSLRVEDLYDGSQNRTVAASGSWAVRTLEL